MSLRPPPFTEPFRRACAAATTSVLCDVWGVVHNGVAATPDACDALTRFRARGGTVVLITNAPRPGEVVHASSSTSSACRATAYDGIVSSGDVTRALMPERPGETRVPYRAGARPADLRRSRRCSFVPIESADYVVCSGLFDDDDRDARRSIARCSARCASASCSWSAPIPTSWSSAATSWSIARARIADLYAALGGEVIYAGKPHRPIYEQALARRRRSCAAATTAHARVLAIGDSVRTDLKGAAAFGIDCLFVTAGIHAEELGGRDNPDADGAGRDVRRAPASRPKLVMRQLAW